MHTATELVLKSGICPQTHLQVQKRIYAQGRGFAVEYTHTNISQGVLSLAPWEITRVAGGVTFSSANLLLRCSQLWR